MTQLGQLMSRVAKVGPPPPGRNLPDPAQLPAKQTQQVLLAETLQEMRHAFQTLTAYANRLMGRMTNDVLSVATVIIDASGMAPLQFHAVVGSIEVNNVSAHTVIVASGGPNPNAAVPTAGNGIYAVAAGTSRTVNVASHQITLYGTAADVVSYQCFSDGARPGVV